MPEWILLVSIAHLLLAFVSLVDKYIVTSKKVPKAILLTFFVGLMALGSNLVFFLKYLRLGLYNFGINLPIFDLPDLINVSWPSESLLVLIILSGYSFLLGIYFSYKAYKKADASDVVPIVGSVNAVFTLIISYFVLEQKLSVNFFIGFILLVIGTSIVSHFRFKLQTLLFTIYSGIFFAIHYTTLKIMFLDNNYDQAFFWSRLGIFFSALTLLFIPGLLSHLKIKNHKQTLKTSLLVFGNVILGGVAGILITKAIDIGDVSLIQALNGLQFAFVFFLSLILGKITPIDFGENNTIRDIIQKTISVLIILIGFSMLFI